jgi:hypothetical protein
LTSLPKPAQGLLLRPEIASFLVKISLTSKTGDKSDIVPLLAYLQFSIGQILFSGVCINRAFSGSRKTRAGWCPTFNDNYPKPEYSDADFLMDRIVGAVDRGDLFGPELHNGLIGSRRPQTAGQQKMDQEVKHDGFH